VQDDLFWAATQRQVANLALLSFSWTYGTIREVGGGILAGVKHPSRISLTHPDYDPRLGYVLGLPVAAFLMSNAYTWMKTGAPPKDFDDALDNTFGPKTGGHVTGVGGRGDVVERAALPGNIKDIVGWYYDARAEAYNKLGPGSKMLLDMILTGKDWQGRDIKLHDWSDPPGWMADYYRYLSQFQPISVQQVERGQKPGSRITPTESMFGIRPAPAWIEDPAGMASFMKRKQLQELRGRTHSDVRQQNIYGGPQE
jgi:hypothetical protein